MLWEYKVLRLEWVSSALFSVKNECPSVEAELNALGDQGWELVSATNSTQFGLALAIMKRPKEKG